MLVELDDELTKCSICMTKFSSDRDNTDPEIRKHLPVLSSSQRCDHWFCHDCVLKEQLRVAGENNGRIPKWIKCMQCREKTSFNLAEPKYHWLLIDLLARAKKYAADQVKNEDNEKSVHAELTSADSNTVNDEEERELKQSDLPSPPLLQVKEEPVEYDDRCDDSFPLLGVESASTEMIQSDADSSNDEQSSRSESIIYDSDSSSSSSDSSSSSSKSSCSSSSSYSYEAITELLTMTEGK